MIKWGESMYHVLVAEDEVWIRNAIVEMIERFDLGFKVVAQASDGMEAWNLINQCWPNVVITDIVMPQLDGLSLLQKCDEYHISMVPIVISGYENFKYAQQAMRYGATEYLLKPVPAEDLKRALTRSVERLQQFHSNHEPLHKIQHFIETMEMMNHQQLVKDAVQLILYIGKMKADTRVKSGLYRIFANKLNDQLDSVIRNYRKLPLDNDKDAEAIQSYFVKLLEEWSRHQHRDEQKNRALLKKVNEYVQKNYHKDITLSQIADYTDLSISRFCVLFKMNSGDSFINYVNMFRIEKAKHLLLDTDLKVYEVADMVGFSSLPYFNRLFKSVANQTPNEYRRSLGL
ncbi:putative response regulatory protein [Paenibacillus konkukensis]|uniref:Response regulatory protein n=1 Tax=Paenibacillus konkukensis TaxID=2020716 RepID=A0ABY4RE03_9BACL|nr:response regulator [Paenibacillus konkukensis]UQZ80931.1 putative response regulatory protein [Paenibacillus konkukensis]